MVDWKVGGELAGPAGSEVSLELQCSPGAGTGALGVSMQCSPSRAEAGTDHTERKGKDLDRQTKAV